MERIFECQNCRNNYEAKYYFLAPFCSERCEELFTDYAPISLIDDVYSQHKKELNKPEPIDHEVDTIHCEYCRIPIDYGDIDNRVIKVCSPLCSDMFMNTLQ